MTLAGYKQYPRESTPDGPAIRTEYGLILLHRFEDKPDMYFSVRKTERGLVLDGDIGGKGNKGGFGRPAEIYRRVRIPTLEEFIV